MTSIINTTSSNNMSFLVIYHLPLLDLWFMACVCVCHEKRQINSLLQNEMKREHIIPRHTLAVCHVCPIQFLHKAFMYVFVTNCTHIDSACNYNPRLLLGSVRLLLLSFSSYKMVMTSSRVTKLMFSWRTELFMCINTDCQILHLFKCDGWRW